MLNDATLMDSNRPPTFRFRSEMFLLIEQSSNGSNEAKTIDILEESGIPKSVTEWNPEGRNGGKKQEDMD